MYMYSDMYMYIHVHDMFIIAMEPLSKGHVGASHFVLCREVVCSSEVENVLTIWVNEHLGPYMCPL